jgi:hypothetical protein
MSESQTSENSQETSLPVNSIEGIEQDSIGNPEGKQKALRGQYKGDKTSTLSMRISESQKGIWKACAKLQGVALSMWINEVCNKQAEKEIKK